jgi:sulfite dehydrogenase (cytochrome) subunit A
VQKVEISTDGGAKWTAAQLGKDEGKYGFRAWHATLVLPKGETSVLVRATNTQGLAQPMTPTWNPSGFMRNVVETTRLVVA